MSSAPEEPPGSLVRITFLPLSSSDLANSFAWVDFPDPSIPSNVIKRPLDIKKDYLSGF